MKSETWHPIALIIILLWCGLGPTSPGYSQATKKGITDERARDLALATRQNDPQFKSSPLQDDDGVAVDLTEKDSTARLRVAFPAPNATWSLTVEAPIDKDTGRSDAIDESGFSNAVNLGIDYTWFYLKWIKVDPEYFNTKKNEACTAYFSQLEGTKKQRIIDGTKDLPGYKKLLESPVTKDRAPIDLLVEYRCAFDTGDDLDLGTQMEQENFRNVDPATPWIQKLRSSVREKRYIPMLSFGAKTGVKDFDFVELDPTETAGLDDASIREEPRSFRLSLGLLYGGAFKKDKVLWLTYLGSTSYKDAEAAEVCSPIEGTDLESCKDQPFGPPTQKDQELLVGEYRTFVGKGGLALKSIHDFEKKNWGARGEFYFVRDNEGALTGGVGIEWDEEEGISGSIFLSQGFNFSPSS